MSKNDVWELSHKVLGIEIKIYDIIVGIFLGALAGVVVMCWVISWLKGEEVIKGEYLTNGFTSFTEQGGQKAFKMSAFKFTNKKVIGGFKKGNREEIICTSCGATLMTTN